jgi:inward rectifier potassium channel
MAGEFRLWRNRPIPVLRGDFQLLKMGASRFDLSDPYHMAVSLSWPAFAAALLALWLSINLLFAAVYVLSPGDIANARPGSFSDAFFFSIETLATVGYGVMSPATPFGHVTSSAEIVTGMAFTAIVTGLLFVRFSRPKAKIVYADSAVVTTFNGHHTLMIRLANARITTMTSANARLFALIGEQTKEGRFFRRIHDLPLLQSHLPLFVLPWTLMHVLNESSPLFGIDKDTITKEDLRLFLTIEARDQVLAAQVHDMKLYTAEQIRFGVRYADSVRVDVGGQATADLSRISLLESGDGDGPEAAQWAR